MIQLLVTLVSRVSNNQTFDSAASLVCSGLEGRNASSCLQFSAVQNSIYIFRKPHIHSTRIFRSSSRVAIESVPMMASPLPSFFLFFLFFFLSLLLCSVNLRLVTKLSLYANQSMCSVIFFDISMSMAVLVHTGYSQSSTTTLPQYSVNNSIKLQARSPLFTQFYKHCLNND